MALFLECSVHVAYEKIFACRRGEFIHKLSPYVNVANLSLLLQAAMFENKREKIDLVWKEFSQSQMFVVVT